LIAEVLAAAEPLPVAKLGVAQIVVRFAMVVPTWPAAQFSARVEFRIPDHGVDDPEVMVTVMLTVC
jgi:hypothetical protein